MIPALVFTVTAVLSCPKTEVVNSTKEKWDQQDAQAEFLNKETGEILKLSEMYRKNNA